MAKNVLILMEPSRNEPSTPLKIGSLFYNRFGIDENDAFDIRLYHLKDSSYSMSHSEKSLKGTNHEILTSKKIACAYQWQVIL